MSSIDSNQAVQPGRWKEVVPIFLKIGALAYGGPAIMGIMQAELQEKRQWLSKERFVEGLSLVNLLPGAGATQLSIFLGYTRAGWWGGLLAGLCFVLPAFLIMLGLTLLYNTIGGTPAVRGALYGLGPVVLGIFAVAVYRLGKNAITARTQIIIAVIAAAATASPIGIAMILALAGGFGIMLFCSRKLGILVLIAFTTMWTFTYFLVAPPLTAIAPGGSATGLGDIGVFFFKVGAVTFGGGLTMISFVQDQVVTQFHWLTSREFIDGLALGQFTPGPILMVAAYVGFKFGGGVGALVAAAAIFLPSFILMLSILPIFDRVRQLAWMKAAMKGISPAVIGVITVSLAQMAPHAVPDALAFGIFIATVIALLVWKVGTIKIMLGGALVGMLRDRLA